MGELSGGAELAHSDATLAMGSPQEEKGFSLCNVLSAAALGHCLRLAREGA